MSRRSEIPAKRFEGRMGSGTSKCYDIAQLRIADTCCFLRYGVR